MSSSPTHGQPSSGTGGTQSPSGFERQVLNSARELRSPCGKGDLVWRRWGEARRAPLILLHGGFGSWRHFALNVLALAEHYSIYAVDLPGLGDSDNLPGPYDADSIARTVSQGIDYVLPPDEPFHVCGFSFGGIISGPVAQLQGERALSYTGVAPGALGLPFAPLPELVSPRPSMRGAEMTEVHRHNLSRLMIHDPVRVDELAVHLQYETVRRARARSGRIPTSTVLADALRQLSPTTRANAIWGSEDVIVRGYLDERRQFFGALANHGRFEVIEGAGHWVMYEQPETFNAVLLRVLAAQS